MCREYTTEEVREKVLNHIWALIEYWDGGNLPHSKTRRERLEGFAHSLLAMLDGSSAELPGFIIAPCPHEDDREWRKARGENWYPENDAEKPNSDIGGGLHSLLFRSRD